MRRVLKVLFLIFALIACQDENLTQDQKYLASKLTSNGANLPSASTFNEVINEAVSSPSGECTSSIPEEIVLAPTPSPLTNLSELASIDSSYKIPDGLSGFGDQCTIVYARHGLTKREYYTEKKIKLGATEAGKYKSQLEDDAERAKVSDGSITGVAQAQNLAPILQNYESQYGQAFDYIFHSSAGKTKESEGRTKLTLNPYLQASGKPAVEDSTLNECESNSECREMVDTFYSKLMKNYCKKVNGKPASILILGHGSYGKFFLAKLTGKSPSDFSHPQNVRPYVLTKSSGGDNFKALHIPK
jgi:hypothetical protein